jgi:hypothetical protein
MPNSNKHCGASHKSTMTRLCYVLSEDGTL